MFSLTAPIFLTLLLLAVPFFLLTQQGTKTQSKLKNRNFLLLLRLVSLACLALALAGVHRKAQSNQLVFAFLIDISKSIPKSQQRLAIDQVNTIIKSLEPMDQYCVISFAKQPSVSVPLVTVQNSLNVSPESIWQNAIVQDYTDLASAIQLAISMLPEVAQKRIVLFSDGLQNTGRIDSILELAQASEITVLTIPILAERKNEVIMQELQIPPKIRIGEIFKVRAIVENTMDQVVSINLYRNGFPMITHREISLKSGKQIIALDQQIFDAGTHEFQIEVIVADEVSENNTAYALTQISGQSRLLCIASNPFVAKTIKTVLESENFVVDVIRPSEFPTDFTQLQNNDGIILINVSADELSQLQMNQIETYVRDFGRGLVVIGGDHSFGRGSYQDTLLERMLPLKMTPKQQKESLSILMLIDTSGSMANYVGADQKIGLAIESIRLAINSLDEADLVGVVSFATSIGLEIPPTTDHQRVAQAVGSLRPRNGTQLFPALQKAYKLIKKTEAKQKHIVILSDGKSDGDFESLTALVAKDNITITTIAIGDAAQDLLRMIARNGKGRYVHVEDMTRLPRILAEEVHLTQEYTVQETFVPRLNQTTQILGGIRQPPNLHGYIATSEKKTGKILIKSHKDHPILAVWDYGLGRSVAFTSDLNSWGRDWISWENFGKFWTQVVSAVLPQPNIGKDFDIQTSINGEYIKVVVEAKNLLAAGDSSELVVRVSQPNYQGQPVEMIRTTPTRYEGKIKFADLGAYLITAKTAKDQQTTSLVVSYPSELASFTTNQQLLHKIADQTNGVFKPSMEEIAARPSRLIKKSKDLAPMFLIICVIFFVLEMIIRQFRFKNYQTTVTSEPPVTQRSMPISTLADQKLEIDSSIQKLLHAKRRSTTDSQMTS
ncbi:MAG: VWA domain-containing protein [Candidatus Poribacteria bacterium]